MNVNGRIVDSSTNAGIPSASITIQDIDGNQLPGGGAADGSGHFQLINVPDGAYLVFSSIGYSTAMTSVEDFNQVNIIDLDQTSQALAPVVITPTKKNDNTGVMVLAGLGIFALLSTGKRKAKSVAGVFDNVNWINVGIGGAVIIGGYYLGNKLGLWGKSSGQGGNNKSVTDSLAAVQTSLNQEIKNGNPPVYSSAQYAGWANTIFSLGVSGTPVPDGNQYNIIWTVMQCDNLADLLSLKLAFGARAISTGSWLSLCAAFGIDCTSVDFDTFIKLAVTNTSYIQELDNYLSSDNINYHF